MSALADAVGYEKDHGWSPIPLRPSDNTPFAQLLRVTRGDPSWTTFRDNHATEREIHDWFELEPRANVGVITGETSGGLGVLDVDDLEAGFDLPPTATVATPRPGRHYFVRLPGPTRTEVFEWGEFRAEGVYVAAPPSRRRDGAYEWLSTVEEAGLADASELDFASRANLQPFLSQSPTYVLLSRDSRDSLPLLGSKYVLLGDSPLAALADLDREEVPARRLAGVLGVPDAPFGRSFPCVLHPDRSASASLWRAEEGAHVLYHDFHFGKHGGSKWMPLALVRARLAGRHGRLGRPELAVWKIRLAVEAGLLEPVRFVTPDLDLHRTVREVLDGFLLLLGCRWAFEPGLPAPFARRFAVPWSGVAERHWRPAFAQLRARELVVPAGEVGPGIPVFLPGEGVVPLL